MATIQVVLSTLQGGGLRLATYLTQRSVRPYDSVEAAVAASDLLELGDGVGDVSVLSEHEAPYIAPLGLFATDGPSPPLETLQRWVRTSGSVSATALELLAIGAAKDGLIEGSSLPIIAPAATGTKDGRTGVLSIQPRAGRRIVELDFRTEWPSGVLVALRIWGS